MKPVKQKRHSIFVVAATDMQHVLHNFQTGRNAFRVRGRTTRVGYRCCVRSAMKGYSKKSDRHIFLPLIN